jgi:hypothetical protein
MSLSNTVFIRVEKLGHELGLASGVLESRATTMGAYFEDARR